MDKFFGRWRGHTPEAIDGVSVFPNKDLPKIPFHIFWKWTILSDDCFVEGMPVRPFTSIFECIELTPNLVEQNSLISDSEPGS